MSQCHGFCLVSTVFSSWLGFWSCWSCPNPHTRSNFHRDVQLLVQCPLLIIQSLLWFLPMTESSTSPEPASFTRSCASSLLCHTVKAQLYFFVWLIHTVALCPLLSLFIFLFCLLCPPFRVQLHSPNSIIKTVSPCRSSSLVLLASDEQPAFHRKVLSLPWIRGINSIT